MVSVPSFFLLLLNKKRMQDDRQSFERFIVASSVETTSVTTSMAPYSTANRQLLRLLSVNFRETRKHANLGVNRKIVHGGNQCQDTSRCHDRLVPAAVFIGGHQQIVESDAGETLELCTREPVHTIDNGNISTSVHDTRCNIVA
jgi:hypothetical protein